VSYNISAPYKITLQARALPFANCTPLPII